MITLSAKPQASGDNAMSYYLAAIILTVLGVTFGGFTSGEVIAIIGAIASGVALVIARLEQLAVRIIAAMKAQASQAIKESPLPTTPAEKDAERKAIAEEVAKKVTPPPAPPPQDPPPSSEVWP